MSACRPWMADDTSGRAVNLNHTPVGDDKDADRERPHGDTDKQTLEPQTKQRSDVHFHQPFFQVHDNRADVD